MISNMAWMETIFLVREWGWKMGFPHMDYYWGPNIMVPRNGTMRNGFYGGTNRCSTNSGARREKGFVSHFAWLFHLRFFLRNLGRGHFRIVF